MKKINQIQVEKISVKELPSGDFLKINVFTIESETPGPTAYFQSSMHGSEHQGSAVIYTLMDYFTNNHFKGKIIFVPNCNPYAINNKKGQTTSGRFDPTTGENWNRLYQNFTAFNNQTSFEFVQDFLQKNHSNIRSSTIQILINTFKNELTQKLNKVLLSDEYLHLNDSRKLHICLQKITLDCDIVIDLHTGPNATRYLYSPEYLQEEYKHFNFPFNIIIPEKFWGAMDEVAFIPWSHFMNELKENHNIDLDPIFSSYTLELGSEERLSFEEAQSDMKNIINYLNHKGMIIEHSKLLEKTKSYSTSLNSFKTYYNSKAGLYDFLKKPGDFCKKGEIMAKGLNFNKTNIEDMTFNFVAKEDCIVINHFLGASIPSGSEVYQVMENYS